MSDHGPEILDEIPWGDMGDGECREFVPEGSWFWDAKAIYDAVLRKQVEYALRSEFDEPPIPWGDEFDEALAFHVSLHHGTPSLAAAAVQSTLVARSYAVYLLAVVLRNLASMGGQASERMRETPGLDPEIVEFFENTPIHKIARRMFVGQGLKVVTRLSSLAGFHYLIFSKMAGRQAPNSGSSPDSEPGSI